MTSTVNLVFSVQEFCFINKCILTLKRLFSEGGSKKVQDIMTPVWFGSFDNTGE
jgi:hypothetical protein